MNSNQPIEFLYIFMFQGVNGNGTNGNGGNGGSATTGKTAVLIFKFSNIQTFFKPIL